MPKDNSIQSVLIIGSGPIIIGQACEFDYSGTQAARSLREEGIKVYLINSNPATIMTDPMMADKVYLLPLTVESIEQILQENQIDAVLPTMGGQTALNCALDLARHGVLEKYQVELIDVTPHPISTTPINNDDYAAMLKLSKIVSYDILSPKKQISQGIEPDAVKCSEGKFLILKFSDNSPGCVKLSTANVLYERSWGEMPPPCCKK